MTVTHSLATSQHLLGARSQDTAEVGHTYPYSQTPNQLWPEFQPLTPGRMGAVYIGSVGCLGTQAGAYGEDAPRTKNSFTMRGHDELLLAMACSGGQSPAPLPAPCHPRWTPAIQHPWTRTCWDHSPGRACSHGLGQAAGYVGTLWGTSGTP